MNGAWAEFEKLNGREQQCAFRGMSSLLHDPSGLGQELLERLNNSGDDNLMEMGRLEVARSLGRRAEIEQAESWLESQDLPGPARAKLEDTIAQAWALDDPRVAAEWLDEQAGPAAGHRLRAVIGLWADWGPVECAKWLNQEIQQGQNMDGSIDAFARNIASKEPGTAISWAAHIRDGEQRRKTSEFLGESFRRQLISNAEELINNSKLPEAEKEAALRKLR